MYYVRVYAPSDPPRSIGRIGRCDEVQGKDGRRDSFAERAERRTDTLDGAVRPVQIGNGTPSRRRPHHDRFSGLHGSVQSRVQVVTGGQLGGPAHRKEDTVHVEFERHGMSDGHGNRKYNIQ